MPSLPANLDEIRFLEESLHRSEVRGSREVLEKLLAIDFVEFGASGTVYGRGEIISSLVRETADDSDKLIATNFALATVSADAVLLTYESQHRRNDESVRSVLRSSIWKHNGADWQMLFHQGTIKNRTD
ncbi:DUF4440 domain-containing protein [Roseibium sp. RKSG952]|uniref:nuclear transport factor 2 family protein n=1 Tax=Roseibium sp. RKSG952 TaxID=2529384 RepID=UPI0012BC3E43|nr:DUF4440 domain-containing protein [Roseibium sp. RKSG952]MTH95310.1 DUF4440 domain-containing protein [Roseibium sp. RKSG952]